MRRDCLPLVVLVSVVALLFPGCGGDEDSTATASSSPTPITSATSATPEGNSTAPAGGTATPEADGDGEPTATAEATGAATTTSTATPEATATPTPSPTPAPTPVAPQPIAVTAALGGRVFDRPVELGAYPGGGVFVADQSGVVYTMDLDGGNESTLLDIRDRVLRGGNEEGLLSVALDPGFASNGHLWVYYSRANPRRSVLSRFEVGANGADPASELVVLQIEEPFANHNGGSIRFGPDGMLYLGFGDGGGAGDPLGSGQDRSTLLASIIRIDVRNASEGSPYAVPADNPFVGEAGARPEIWAYGVRNPWRMAWDGGTLWLGDVGQSAIEEIDIVARGANLGWSRLEGNQCYQAGCSGDGTRYPVAQYGHSGGRCSVTGGVVYRGPSAPEVAGSYLYGDFCSGEVWALPADLSGEPVLVASGLGSVSSFGVDAAGEVYVLRFGQSIVRVVSP